MNGTTILLWITIFIIGAIAIITVKLHYKGDELEKDEKSILPTETIGGVISYGRDKISNVNNTPQDNPTTEKIDNDYNVYTMDEVEEKPIENTSQNQVLANYENKIEKETIENESENQVLLNYENNVEQIQKPTNEDQIDNMTPNNDQNNEKSELKDLFTIDELIKESKRKDSEREKEAQQINNDEEDEELEEIKESIRKRKENDDEIEEQLIEEILADEDIEKLLAEDEPVDEIVEVEESKEETIQDIIDNSEPQEETISEEIKEEPITPEEPQEETIQDVLDVEETAPSEIETPVATQKDIEEAINTASQEIEEEKVEEISDSENITDALLNSQEEVEEEIKQPTLKSPTKIDKTKKEDEIGAPIDDSNLINETEEENDLDYRKDINKITNKIKGSRLFKDVRDKLIPEPEPEVDPIADLEESYIRNVNEYEDEYAPIINETHDYFGSELGETYEPDYDEAIRQENTRRLFGDTQQSPEPEIAEPKKEIIKSKPARDNIKIQLNNTEVVLKKGDEIIYRHDGETYSSQVYAINGDEISVKYRRQNIIIKPEDVKKIY